MTGGENEEVGAKQVHLCTCCSLWQQGRVQTFHLRTPAVDEVVRNVKVLDHIIYLTPGSAAWKRSRVMKLVVMMVFMVPIPPVLSAVALVLENDTTTRSTFSVVAGILGLWLGVAVLLFANVDIVKMRIKNHLFIVDLVSLVVVVVLLALYGQEYVFFGIGGFSALTAGAYCTEGVEVDFDLNTGGKPLANEVHSAPERRSIDWRVPTQISDEPEVNHIMKTWVAVLVKWVSYLSLTSGAFILRGLVFIKVLTISDETVFTVFDGANVITLRDIWEVWVDILFLRLVYICIHRLTQTAGSYSFVQNNARIITPRA